MWPRQRAGFTIIELLVVIAIVGLLSSIVLVSLNSARSKARDARRIADIRSIQLALGNYYDAFAQYPLTSSALAPTYVAVVPRDPQSNAAYSYAGLQGTAALPASCQSYHVGATLENGTNAALNNDSDAAAATICTGGGTDFAGTDPIYDVKP